MNGKGSKQRPVSNQEWFNSEYERIFRPMEVEALEEFLDNDLEEAQVDVVDFIQDRKRNES